jgi:molybdopterin converting factor small subunit
VIVRIPTPLRSYTGDAPQVEGHGATLADVLADLDRRYPGVRFRMIDEHGAIRPHIKLFVGETLARALDTQLRDSDTVHIICALSGG